MIRILVTGGSSYLGQHLVPQALANASNEVAYTFYQNDPLQMPQGRRLDILDASAVQQLLLDFRPDAVIHTVGSNRGDNFDEIIRQGIRNIAQAASAVKARLIHLSTDVVFDGRDAPYDEDSPVSPIHEYGRAKAAAESIVSNHSNHVIIRTSLIYGLNLMDHSTRWMAEALRAGQPVMLFDNQYRNPVWVNSLSAACLELTTRDYHGILHVAGGQRLSRAEFSMKMLDWWGIDERETLSVGPSIGNNWPLDCELLLHRARSLLTTSLPGVDWVLNSARPAN